jgi:CO/xanthine dehydrogenase Mo-binding subunit
MEATIDKLARMVGMDASKFREKNMIAEGQTSPVYKIMGEGTEGVDMIVESCKLDYCIKRGKELIAWDKKYPCYEIAPGKMRGVGMAIAAQGSGIPGIDMASAILKLNDGGFFNLLMGATDIGTGSDTILSQIAAETLGISTDDIVTYSSDTDLTPFDTGAYASSTTYNTGNAVRLAAENMKKMIEEEGAKIFGVSKDTVVFDGKLIKTEDGKHSIALKELSEKLYYSQNQRQLVATDSFVGKVSPPPFLAGFAEVEVDMETGKVDLVDYVAVVDCGTTINPNLARIQVEGGIVQGIGMAMYEDVRYSPSGKLLTNNFMYYKIPTRKEINSVRVEFADSYEPTGPYGAKSVGEIGIDTPPAAITNAVYNAAGVSISSLPITPEKVLMAIKKKKA